MSPVRGVGSDVDVTDTTAFRITRQVMDHVYGEDEEMDERDFSFVHGQFRKAGGSWESIMAGSMADVGRLEGAIESLVNLRRISKIAFRIVRGG